MEYRCYHFGNFYLSQIQQGIQSYHGMGELALKYRNGKSAAARDFWEWLANHKTVMCLNGGNLEMMKELWDFIDTKENPFAYARFFEGEDALGGIMTNIAIVLPEAIFGEYRTQAGWPYKTVDFCVQLHEKLKGYSLA